MNKYSKILLSVLGASLVCVSALKAEEAANEDNRVMFKIHDIIPEKDPEGRVLYCNASATFYNRSASDISKANMNLVWFDEVIDDTISREKRDALKKEKEGVNGPMPRHTTSEYTSKDISVLIRLPQIKSKQQLSLKTKIETDRCFLLLKDMEFTVDNCSISGSDTKTPQDCSGLFQYVSPSMPEYYNDFKEISYDTQMLNDTNDVNSMKSDIEDAYNNAVMQIKKITTDTAE